MMETERLAASDGPSGGRALGRLALAFAGLTALLFSLGLIAGVTVGSIERGALRPLGVIAIIVALAIAVGAGMTLRRIAPSLMSKQNSPRIGKARQMVILSGAVGGALGLVLALATLGSVQSPSDAFNAFSSSPVPAWAAIVAIAVWLGLVPWLTLTWHRNIDEHEAQAYRDGALAGIYSYFEIAPTWWMAWRGGLVGEPQEMPIFLAVITVVGVVWAWRRYR